MTAICFAESPIRAARSEKQGVERAIQQIPAEYRDGVALRLQHAEDNRDALLAAIEESAPEQRAAVAFLLANMPEIDLRTLPKDLLLENIDYARSEERRGGKECRLRWRDW